MPTGKLKFWNADRGFGFIKPEESGPDLFVHVSGVMSDPRRGQQVSFEIEEDRKTGRPKAVRVRAL